MSNRNPNTINLERHQFKMAFAYLFPVTTKSMVQKCWRDFARLPEAERGWLLRAMQTTGLAQSAVDEAKLKAKAKT